MHDRYHHAVKQATYAVQDNHALWEGRTLRAWTDVLVDTLVAEFDPVSIILFGSLATESDGPNSDIDLLVTSIADFERNSARPGTTEYEPAQHGVAVYERVAT